MFSGGSFASNVFLLLLSLAISLSASFLESLSLHAKWGGFFFFLMLMEEVKEMRSKRQTGEVLFRVFVAFFVFKSSPSLQSSLTAQLRVGQESFGMHGEGAGIMW